LGISKNLNLGRYIIRASFSQERMQYLADEGTVIYSAKDGKDRKVFDALEWLTAMCSHVPNWGEQMVRYYGWYSNVSRRKRRKRAEDDAVPYIIESDRHPAACRKSWARLIQKTYEADPLVCPKCQRSMRISFIEDPSATRRVTYFPSVMLNFDNRQYLGVEVGAREISTYQPDEPNPSS
jgi:hypothetical protein